MAQGTVGEPLDGDAPQRGEDDGEQHDEKDEEQRADASQPVGLGEREPDHAEIGSDHVDLTVREIDQLENAIDHGVSERDQRIDATERQAVD